MKARFNKALPAVAASLALGLSTATALAQPNRVQPAQRGQPDPNAPRVMVPVFRAADKNAGVQASDAVRSRLQDELTYKQAYVLPKADVVNNLEASGFPTNEALTASDARALAQQLRADEYITGQVVRDSVGTRVDASMVLTRDNALVQPLGSFRVNKPSDAAKGIVSEFRAAQAQFGPERDCVNAARAQKWQEAIAAARRGIAAYPKSTLARLCVANVMREMKAPADSIIAVTRQVLAIDPRSRNALTLQYEALDNSGRKQEASELLLQLAAADPTNTSLIERVVNSLAGSGQAAKAVPYVNQLVNDNPGDPSFLSLKTRVLFAAKDYKGGIATFQELARTDTAAATAELYQRAAAAAQLDSQPQVAAQLLAGAVARFPQNGALLVEYADALRTAGQTQQALDLLTRASQQNPRPAGVYVAQGRLLGEQNKYDDALRAFQQAKQAGDSANLVAQSALLVGQNAYKAATASKDSTDFNRAITILEFANTTSPTPEGQFLLGVTQLSLGQQTLQDAQKNRSCSAVDRSRTLFASAQQNIGVGGRSNPQAAQQALAALGQLSAYPDQLGRALKCGGSSGGRSR